MAENGTAAGKVLVVDDDLAISGLVQLVLSRDGYQVYVAGNGQEGIAMAREVQPNLVLMDITMPDMDGYEATRQMKADKGLQNIPVIFLTGKSASEDGGRAFATGGLTYMRKPFSNQQLRDLVMLAIRYKGLLNSVADWPIQLLRVSVVNVGD
jgi:CheY-like chemotaxis protein